MNELAIPIDPRYDAMSREALIAECDRQRKTLWDLRAELDLAETQRREVRADLHRATLMKNQFHERLFIAEKEVLRLNAALCEIAAQNGGAFQFIAGDCIRIARDALGGLPL